MTKAWKFAALVASVAMVSACKTTGDTAPASASGADSATTSGSTGTTTGGTTGSAGGSTGTSGGSHTGSIPTLVNVNLQNVLNDLSVSLQVNRDSIPVTAQVPVDVAATVCGVSVDALAASVASGNATCTATTSSPQLTQVVQQQISTGGSVTGGDQNTNVPPPRGN
jgi:hypothetical protein